MVFAIITRSARGRHAGLWSGTVFEPQDRQGARDHRPAAPVRPRRRGDRM